MKKYFQILKFAFKEQLEYRRNFFFGMITMVINDAIFLAVFAIFLSYFTGTGLTLGNFLIIESILCIQFALVHGFFSNIGELPEIIEGGKMDYYLSFPLSPLAFLSMAKIKVHNVGDVVFGIICLVVYLFYFNDWSIIPFLMKWLAIIFISLFFVAGLFILAGSISFYLQRGSKIRDLFQSFFLVFGSYPPDIFKQNKVLFVLISVVWLYPAIFLPYKMLIQWSTRIDRIILIGASILMFLIGIYTFHKGLKRYSSGNLVLQM